MSNTLTLKNTFAAVSMVALLGAGGSAALAQEKTGGGIKSVVKCDAKGGKQEMGAIIGALAGAAAGSNLAKNDRGTGTAVGAAVGAAAGSWTGCKMQRDEAAAGKRAYKGEPAGTYSSGGYRLAPHVAPARFSPAGGSFVATSNLNLRAAPTAKAQKVGAMAVGERFEALAYSDGWILVGHKGVGVGYVHGGYTRPASQVHYAGW